MNEEAGIFAREASYLGRHIQFGAAQGRVLSLTFPNAPDDEAMPDHELLDRIDGYLDGTEDDFADVTVALTVSTDRRRVLETVREIPYGEQVSVAQLLRMTPDGDPDDEDDVRTARTALADNPAPLLIPDHRVRDGPSAAPAEVEQRLRSLEGL